MTTQIDVINRDDRHFVRIDEDGEVREMRFVSERSARDYARVLQKRHREAEDNVISLH